MSSLAIFFGSVRVITDASPSPVVADPPASCIVVGKVIQLGKDRPQVGSGCVEDIVAGVLEVPLKVTSTQRTSVSGATLIAVVAGWGRSVPCVVIRDRLIALVVVCLCGLLLLTLGRAVGVARIAPLLLGVGFAVDYHFKKDLI